MKLPQCAPPLHVCLGAAAGCHSLPPTSPAVGAFGAAGCPKLLSLQLLPSTPPLLHPSQTLPWRLSPSQLLLSRLASSLAIAASLAHLEPQ